MENQESEMPVRFEVYDYRSMTSLADVSSKCVWETAGGHEEWTIPASQSPLAAMFGPMLGGVDSETWFYLSFADGHLPKDEQFLGGAYVRADTLVDAVTRSHELGILSRADMDEHVPVDKRERLLSRDEINP
jgi:hypothetical protein